MITALAVASFLGVSAQYTVTGTLREQQAEQGAASALYHIYAESDTLHPVINNITDLEGRFNQNINSPGRYVLKTEYPGTYPASIPFSVGASSPTAELGEVVLRASSEALDEVVVTAKKAIVVSDGANINYNVTEDPSAQTMTVLDMLRKVPMVTVDGQDNIRVNGSSNFKIYLNGRPNPMFDNEPQRVLKATPASVITRIEVLTEPGAKYDAEGSGGILNIVIESNAGQQATDGYAGSIEANISRQQTGGTFYIRAKKDKVTGSASITYSTGGVFKSEGNLGGTTEYDDSEMLRLEEKMTTRNMNDYRYLGGNLNFSWEPNASNLFTWSANFTGIKGYQDMTGINTMTDATGAERWRLNTDYDLEIKRPNVSANFSYQHSFGRPDHSLTSSFQYDRANQAIDFDWLSHDPVNYPNAFFPFMNTDSRTANNSYTLQVDYTNTLSTHHTIAFGAKGLLTDNNNTSKMYTGADEASAELSELSKMHQYRNLGALYGTYTGTFGFFSATGGLRYEYTHLGADYKTGGTPDFSSHLNDIVPNASLSYSFDPTTVLRFAYNMRISRPTIDQLNPFAMNVNLSMVSQGNPDLDSQRSNNLSLAFSSFKGRIGYNVRFEQALVKNMISQYRYVRDGITYSTYANAGHQYTSTLSAFVNWQASSKLTASINGAVSYTDLGMENPYTHNCGWGGNFGANVDYTLPLDLKLNAYGGWGARNINLQGWWGGWYHYGLAVRRSFLKEDRLTLTLSAQNFLQKDFTWKGFSKTETSRQYTRMNRKNWNIGLSVTWNFGSLHQDVKKVNSRIDNDDAVKSQNSNGGGSIL